MRSRNGWEWLGQLKSRPRDTRGLTYGFIIDETAKNEHTCVILLGNLPDVYISKEKKKGFFLHLDEYPRNKSISFIVFGQTFPGKFKLAQNHKRNHDYCQRVPKCFKDYRIPEQAGLFANFL